MRAICFIGLALLLGMITASMVGCKAHQTDVHMGVVVKPPYDQDFGNTTFDVKVIKTYR